MSYSAKDLARLSKEQLAIALLALQRKYAEVEPSATAAGSIAVIGLSGRFPGARSVEGFWEELAQGREGISAFSDAEVWAEGVPKELSSRPEYVKAGGILEGADLFDAGFFEISAREAEITDPQHRVFVECAFEAVEDAGYANPSGRGRVGVYAGVGSPTYMHRLFQSGDGVASGYQIFLHNGTDFLATRAAYLLNLHGPAVVVQTACSTSLVAVHLARRAILAGDCDLALAGGVSIRFPQKTGYLYEPGMIGSPDGHCRAFDAKAQGTVGGEGVGVVVLKRLEAALRDRDHIHAVIKGSAINNDGSNKVGYTAPSVEGQAAVIREALKAGHIDPSTIGYIEAHGTGTELGDPIELAGLTEAFRDATGPGWRCPIGSVKSNIGHLDTAAGVASLIKTVLALKHRKIPPSLHFETPNPKLQIEKTPFYVNTTLQAWEAPNGGPRRAGVSSFGIGGTNAHVVLEEAPAVEISQPEMERPLHLLTLSANTDGALRALVGRYRGLWSRESQTPLLGDVCFTANAGRRHFGKRLAVFGQSSTDLDAKLSAFERGEETSGLCSGEVAKGSSLSIAILFAGELEALGDWGKELLATEPRFREVISRCEVAVRERETTVGNLLSDAPQGRALATAALFALQAGLTTLFRRWGLLPEAVLGVGVGKLSAAYAARVLRLEDGVRLAFAMGQVAEGASKETFEALLRTIEGRTPECAIVSAREGRLLEPKATALLAGLLGEPDEPLHLAEATSALRSRGVRAYLEVGPGTGLLGLLRQHQDDPNALWLPSLGDGEGDWASLLRALSALYVRGADLDWEGFDKPYLRRRISLPTYPFQRQRYFVNLPKVPMPEEVRDGTDPEDWIYRPTWESKPRPAATEDVSQESGAVWLILSDRGGVGAALASKLTALSQHCVQVVSGEGACHEDERGVWHVSARRKDDFTHLLTTALRSGPRLAGIVHLWSLNGTPSEATSETSLEADVTQSLASGLHVVQALLQQSPAPLPRVWWVTRGAQAIQAGEPVSVAQAPLLGFSRVVASEHPELGGSRIDLDPTGDSESAAEALLAELWTQGPADEVAHRQASRQVLRLRRWPRRQTPPPPFTVAEDATYLITGGLGGLGLKVAEWLVSKGARHLALLGRRSPSEAAQTTLDALSSAGVTLRVLQGNVASRTDIERVFSELRASTPPLRGVIHAAGILDDGAVLNQTWARFESVLASKVTGTWLLNELTHVMSLDFFVCFSSISAVIGNPGQGNYAAANAFQDAWAQRRSAEGLCGLSINWGAAWGFVGMGAELARRKGWAIEDIDAQTRGPATEILARLIGDAATQAAVMPPDWPEVLAKLSEDSRPLLVSSLIPIRRDEANDSAKTDLAPSALDVLSHAASEADLKAELETIVREEIGRVLGLSPETLEPDEPLMTLGLDSLMAIELRMRLQRRLGQTLPVSLVFEYPTLEALQGYLGTESEALAEWRKVHGEREASMIERVSRKEVLPLSSAQERLWFLEQFERSAANHISGLLRLEGPLDLKPLERSLGEIIRRHEVLRTVFREVEGVPVQVIRGADAVSLVPRDVPSEAEAQVLASVKAAELFDLAQGPLIRFSLYRGGNELHWLTLVMHHSVSDGVSLNIFAEELSTLYAAFSEGRPSPLPELPIQMADVAAWERKWWQGAIVEEQLAYWKTTLEEAPTVLELPTDRQRPPTQTFRGSWVAVDFPPELIHRVRERSRAEEVTLFTTLVSAYALLLARYARQEDLLVGIPISSRERAEVQSLIGMFVNTLVLRTDLTGDPTVTEFLTRLQERILGAQAHSTYPFEKLVSELEPERDLSRTPFFQAAFSMVPLGKSHLALSNLRVTGVPIDPGTAQFDLTAFAGETLEGGLWLTLNYNTDLFDRHTIERMGRHYVELLRGLCDDPTRKLHQLSLMSDAEREEVLTWGRGSRGYDREMWIHQLFEAEVLSRGNHIAVVDGSRELSYAELDAHANQIARFLVDAGVGPDVTVGVFMERSWELVVTLLGILKAGGAYLPLDLEYPEARIQYMLADSNPPVVITQEPLLQRLPASSTHHVRFEDILAQTPSQEFHSVAVSPDALAYVAYTSGSTGTPKGVAVPHRAVVRLAKGCNYATFTPNDVFLMHSPVAFDASTLELWCALLNGARLAVLPPGRASTEEMRDAIRRHNISTIWLTAQLFNLMVDYEGDALQSIRQILTGGEAASPEHWAKMAKLLRPESRLVNGYGPTENTTFSACHVVEAGDGVGTQVPIGRPIGGSDIFVLDRNHRILPVGVPGEIFVAGDGLAREYLNQTNLTEERFLRIPSGGGELTRMYRTGDLGRWIPSGEVEYLGRMDHQIKLRGFRIELGEIDAQLSKQTGVSQAAVIVREDSPGDKRLVGYVTPAEGQELSVTDLRSALSKTLPEYMVPSAFVVLEKLPLTPSGKLDRKALPKPELPTGDAALTPPQSELERQIASVWAEVLEIPPEAVGRESNFFDLGGHSLIAMRLQRRLKAALGEAGRGLRLSDIFQFPTVEALSHYLQPAPTKPIPVSELAAKPFSPPDNLFQEVASHPACLSTGGTEPPRRPIE